LLLVFHYLFDLWLLIKKTHTKGTGLLSIFQFRSLVTLRLSKVVESEKVYEGFIHTMFGPKICLVAIDPESAKFVLKSPKFQKTPFQNSKYVKDNFGTNLVSTDGEDWRRHRLFVNSGFNSKAYASYFPTFVYLTDKCIEKLWNVGHMATVGGVPSGDVNCAAIFSQFTLDVLGNSIFHYDFGRLEGKSDVYYEAHKNILSIGTRFIGVLLALFPFMDNMPINDVKDLHTSVDSLKFLFQRVIEERKQTGTKYGDILDHLLEASENTTDKSATLSPVEIMSTIWIFFVAGHETTASALMWCCAYLSAYPEIQEKVRAEVLETVGKDKCPDLEDLGKMNYLDCFIHEVLRVHAPVTLLPTRRAIEDVQYGNYVIPKDSYVGIGIDIIHKHPLHWTDPEKFDPERFFPENKKGRHHYAYLPFSLGPRQCIGNNFSLIEQRLFLSRLLQNFRVLPPKEFPPQDLSIILPLGVQKEIYVSLEKLD